MRRHEGGTARARVQRRVQRILSEWARGVLRELAEAAGEELDTEAWSEWWQRRQEELADA